VSEAEGEANATTRSGKNSIEEIKARRRRPVPLSDFEDDLNRRNQELRDLNTDPLQDVEMICARLYTGPMYCKYNTVLVRQLHGLQPLW
jgi:hypothetical protein